MTDWAAWSHEAVQIMQARNDEWPKRFGLAKTSYTWDLDTEEIRFTDGKRTVVAELSVVGVILADDTLFRWGWADLDLPHAATCRAGAVRSFGSTHDLPLLTTPELEGGHAQALEALCLAGRVLDAAGVFIDRSSDTAFYFTLHNLRPRS